MKPMALKLLGANHRRSLTAISTDLNLRSVETENQV